MFPSKFKNLNVGYSDDLNWEVIQKGLSTAKAKVCFPEFRLRLRFSGYLKSTMKEMLIEWMKNIVSLVITIVENEDILLTPSLKFDLLESLSIIWFANGAITNHIPMMDSFIAKHADNLKELDIQAFFENDDDVITIPILPRLDQLKLRVVNSKSAWSVLQSCRPTITKLFLYDLNCPMHVSAELNNIELPYLIPNLSYLDMEFFEESDCGFVIENASTLTSMALKNAELSLDVSLILPEFPK